jgi:hypothetical protein
MQAERDNAFSIAVYAFIGVVLWICGPCTGIAFAHGYFAIGYGASAACIIALVVCAVFARSANRRSGVKVSARDLVIYASVCVAMIVVIAWRYGSSNALAQ